ncbi:hypothetical protein K466DRAFT_507116 [Polyporus arcularius HHB13444]|uniref:SWIM-type domain-containing protein n=1 Tax=Polyporus arcularius HHB13444 TaxID=1314778 RepID=A0A5C3NQB0_9APHY|nr:hypothetical protein K466DRAFT_507116 [Polyporus arcularius HHB13444]
MPPRSKFLILKPKEASGQKVPLTALRRASNVYTKELCLTEEQKAKIEALYSDANASLRVDEEFDPEDLEEQRAAASLLASEGLDLDGRAGLGNRWTSRWSMKTGNRGLVTRRVLFQCDCGYHHKSRNFKARRVPVDFTGCLAHAEVLHEVASGSILLVRGYFTHNEACKSAFMTRLPPIPLHPSVFSVALQQLGIGAQLTDIQATNRAMFENCKYEHQPPHADLAKSPYRWLLQKTDTRSLYRQFNRLRGLRTSIAPHVNVDEWLNPSSRAYKPEIAEAVFHYSARADKGDRFEVCLATPEMRESAWKYGHGSQIILDGTFGVCDRKVLLFIAMGVDEAGSGVPLAFFLFSAPSGNNNTSAGYNTDILEKLLRRWKDTLESDRDGKLSVASAFAPKVAITDTDLKERNALVRVFLDIWLLICKFHLRQSWRNHRTRVIKGTSKLHTHVRSRLRELEKKLVDSLDHGEAMSLIAIERAAVESDIQPQDPLLAAGGLAHLTYLAEYWMAESLWCSWSAFGRRVAADKLSREVSMILTTTNHLESFNGVLKRKHLRRWQRGNRRLRIDVLLHILITNILPSVFQARALERQENVRLTAMLRDLPGGAGLVKQLGVGNNGLRQRAQLQQSRRVLPYAILTPDPSRDAAAADFVAERQISVPEYNEHTRSFEFDCFSSLSTASDHVPTEYKIHIGVDGSAACSCPDFHRHGIACKHVRAALLRLDALRSQGLQIPPITLPTTWDEARTRFQSRAPLVTGDLLPNTSPAPTTPTAPSAIQHAAQLVEDILRESADAYKNPGDRTFVPRHEPEATSGDERDSESEETPVTSESDSESDSDDEESDDENLPGSSSMSLSSRDGVGRQAVARVLHELEAMTPQLKQLLGYLEGVSLHRDEVDRARVSQAHLEALSSKLLQLLQEAGKVSTSTCHSFHMNPPTTSIFPSMSFTPPRARTPPPSVPQKRAPSPPSILPPSPEKSQRRQTSYSIH